MEKKLHVIRKIDELLAQKGRYEKDLIDYLGLPTGTFSNQKRGRSDTYYRYTKEICDHLEVTPNEFFMYERPHPDTELGVNEGIFNQQEILAMFSKLSSKERAGILSMLRCITN